MYIQFYFLLIQFQFPSIVNINVGGKKFATRLSTLLRFPESMLAAMFSGRHEVEVDADNHYFIDRFRQKLLYLIIFFYYAVHLLLYHIIRIRTISIRETIIID